MQIILDWDAGKEGCALQDALCLDFTVEYSGEFLGGSGHFERTCFSESNFEEACADYLAAELGERLGVDMGVPAGGGRGVGGTGNDSLVARSGSSNSSGFLSTTGNSNVLVGNDQSFASAAGGSKTSTEAAAGVIKNEMQGALRDGAPLDVGGAGTARSGVHTSSAGGSEDARTLGMDDAVRHRERTRCVRVSKVWKKTLAAVGVRRPARTLGGEDTGSGASDGANEGGALEQLGAAPSSHLPSIRSARASSDGSRGQSSNQFSLFRGIDKRGAGRRKRADLSVLSGASKRRTTADITDPDEKNTLDNFLATSARTCFLTEYAIPVEHSGIFFWCSMFEIRCWFYQDFVLLRIIVEITGKNRMSWPRKHRYLGSSRKPVPFLAICLTFGPVRFVE